MEREYRSWSEIEDIVTEHLREYPNGHRLVHFGFTFEKEHHEPTGFIIDTVNITQDEHVHLSKYVAKFIEYLELIYEVGP